MRRYLLVLCLSVAVLFAAPGDGLAENRERVPKDIVLEKSESSLGDFVGAGDSVDVAGSVSQDVMVAGGTVDISGEVSGDALAVGGWVSVTGPVKGSVRAAGGSVVVRAIVGRNLTIGGGQIFLDPEAKISGNAYVGGGTVTVKGSIDGNLYVGGGSVVLSGEIKGDVIAASEQISVRDGAKIGGKLTYYSKNDAVISDGSAITGGIERKDWPMMSAQKDTRDFRGLSMLWGLLAGLLVAFVAWKIFPGRIQSLLEGRGQIFWRKLLSGLIALIVTPVGAALVMFSLVGIPLGLIALALYAIALYLACLVGALLFGTWLAGYLRLTNQPGRFPWSGYLIGAVAMTVIGLVPILGQTVVLVVWLWGFGSLVNHLKAG